jgi:hypothetical protein
MRSILLDVYPARFCRSRIVRGLAGPLWFVVIISVAVGTYESLRVSYLSL